MRERFVVVAGSPRSGTSLLRTILTRSDALLVHRTEPHYVLELYRQFGHTVTDVPRALDFLAAHEKFPHEHVDVAALRDEFTGRSSVSLAELLRAALKRLALTKPGRPLVLKHPSFILHLDAIKTLFPDLRIIHCIRDPRANVMSQRTRWPSTSLWEAASRWRASVREGRRWQQREVTPYLEVRYEDLVRTPETVCAGICSFLEIPFDPAILSFDHVEREWMPAKPGEGSKRHYQGFEQQRVDKWKTHLQPVEVKLIEDRCWQGMEWFGYERMNPAVDLGTYAPYYLNERRNALRKSIKRMRRQLQRSVGAS
jgi:hypothetical protein